MFPDGWACVLNGLPGEPRLVEVTSSTDGAWAPSVKWPSLGAGQKGDVGGAPTSSDVECHRLISPDIA